MHKHTRKHIALILVLVSMFLALTAESCDSNGNGVGDSMDTFRKVEREVLTGVGVQGLVPIQ